MLQTMQLKRGGLQFENPKRLKGKDRILHVLCFTLQRFKHGCDLLHNRTVRLTMKILETVNKLLVVPAHIQVID
jgi:hypothetical protein